MAKYATYSAYKPTGIERLVELPTHWCISSLRRLLTEPLANGLFKKREHWGNGTKIVNVFDAYTNGDVVDESSLDRVICDESELKKYSVKHGDFVFVRSSLKLDGIGKSASVLNPSESMVFECHLVRGCPDISAIEPKFLCYFLNSSYSRQSLVALSNQVTMATIDQEKFKSLSIAIPTITEQQTIARFLDFKTAQIDALIAKQKTLLDKLAEKRTALISHAVTKGLDPSVPMKDSGVAWLKEIPIDWTTKRLRFLTTMSGGLTPSTSNSEYWGGEIPWITPKDMKSEMLSGSIDTLTDKALQETGITLHDSGRVLIVVRGMILAHTFPVAINNVPSTVNQDMKVLSTTLDYEYLALLLRGIQPLILSVVEESAHGTKVLRTDIFKNIFLPVPPADIQKTIVKQVTSLVAKLDVQKQHIESVTERLKEYRSALITNAVTGKIDVRGFHIPTHPHKEEVYV